MAKKRNGYAEPSSNFPPEEEKKEATEEKQKSEEEAEKSFMSSFHAGNSIIESAIDAFYQERTPESVIGILEAIRQQMHADGHFIVPVFPNETGDEFTFCTLKGRDGVPMFVAFTSQEEFEKGQRTEVISHFIDMLLKAVIDNNGNGFIINPWGQSFMLTRELIEIIFNEDEKQKA